MQVILINAFDGAGGFKIAHNCIYDIDARTLAQAKRKIERGDFGPYPEVELTGRAVPVAQARENARKNACPYNIPVFYAYKNLVRIENLC